MKRKLFCLFLCVILVLCCFAGCGETVGEIAGNVAEAAMKELEAQVKATLEEYKVEVIEVKSAVGKLNDNSDSKVQFYCAALVRANSDVIPKSIAVSLGSIFEEAGCHRWLKSEVDSNHLVHKDITFKHSDFSTGDYYLIYVYNDKLPSLKPSEPTGGVG